MWVSRTPVHEYHAPPKPRAVHRRKNSPGVYQSPNEVLAAALQALDQRDQALAKIRAQIDEGFAQAKRGELLDGDEVFQEIRRRGNERRSNGT